MLTDIKFPIERLKGIRLYNFPYRLMMYRDGWTGAYYHGRAFASHIVFGARVENEKITKDIIGSLIIHELGHALMYLACNCTYENHMDSPKFQEYIKLRGLSSKWTPKSIWAKRPAEIFAEDFRFIFGEDYMKEETHTVVGKGWLPKPPNRIKEFMLNLLEEIKGDEEEQMNIPNKIILHHSATNGGTFESIKRHHMEVRGWRDIGYHYLIEMDGSLHVGRAENEMGAHTLGENESSIGTCIVGNFDKYKPNQDHLKKLNDLISDIFDKYGKLEIRKHSDYANKTCPGTKFPFDEVLAEAFTDKKKEDISEWAKVAWAKAKAKGINDGIGEKDPVTEEQLMVFFDRLGLLD